MMNLWLMDGIFNLALSHEGKINSRGMMIAAKCDLVFIITMQDNEIEILDKLSQHLFILLGGLMIFGITCKN